MHMHTYSAKSSFIKTYIYLGKPRDLQMTLASLFWGEDESSQIVPHDPLTNASTLPSYFKRPFDIVDFVRFANRRGSVRKYHIGDMYLWMRKKVTKQKNHIRIVFHSI